MKRKCNKIDLRFIKYVVKSFFKKINKIEYYI